MWSEIRGDAVAQSREQSWRTLDLHEFGIDNFLSREVRPHRRPHHHRRPRRRPHRCPTTTAALTAASDAAPRATAFASAPDSHGASVSTRVPPQVLNHRSLACGLAHGVGGELALRTLTLTTHHSPLNLHPSPHPDPNPDSNPRPNPNPNPDPDPEPLPGKLSANGRIGGGIDYEKIFLSAFRAEPGLCTSVAADLLRFKEVDPACPGMLGVYLFYKVSAWVHSTVSEPSVVGGNARGVPLLQRPSRRWRYTYYDYALLQGCQGARVRTRRWPLLEAAWRGRQAHRAAIAERRFGHVRRRHTSR